jgi:hypothetical protein
MESILLRGLPPTVADAPDAGDGWANSPVSRLSDAALADAVAGAITPPKREADTSFLIHAPLELAARAALLPIVAPGAREQVRRRIASIAAQYARAGEEVEDRPGAYPNEKVAAGALRAAIREGDLDEVDAAVLYLLPCVSPLDLRRALATDIMPMLGAAAHIPIFLAGLPRLEARLANAGALLRAPLRKLTRYSMYRLSWPDSAKAADAADLSGEALFEALRSPPPVHSDSVYIAPTMLAVEAGGYAERLLGAATAGLPVDAAARAILRIGALSMLQDDAANAPYGWSHALTMPQGVLCCADVVSDKTALIRTAATHALGFRATQGTVRLVDEPPQKPRSDEMFNVAPVDAAGAVYHADEGEFGKIRTALASRAAAHRDAHLAKYTLAAFDAAARDPEAARLFLAAAAYLGAWWDANPDESFE